MSQNPSKNPLPPIKAALITGASSGIGRALALDFAKRGYALGLLARRQDRLQSLEAEIKANYAVPVLSRVGDVHQAHDLQQWVQDCQRQFSRVDIVVANAGFSVLGTVEKLKLEDFRRQFETNVFAVIQTVQFALPSLKLSGGCIGIVGSVMSYFSGPGYSAYSMSKAAMRALCDSLWVECDRYGIAVCHICPGFVESEIHSQAPPRWLMMPSDVAARHISSALIHRKREVVITRHGKLAVFVYRHFPGFILWIYRWFLRVKRRAKVLT